MLWVIYLLGAILCWIALFVIARQLPGHTTDDDVLAGLVFGIFWPIGVPFAIGIWIAYLAGTLLCSLFDGLKAHIDKDKSCMK
jgi:ABC-type Mn2+/Zn2+ transport system permease subunit